MDLSYADNIGHEGTTELLLSHDASSDLDTNAYIGFIARNVARCIEILESRDCYCSSDTES
jgi:hypothetical protein